MYPEEIVQTQEEVYTWMWIPTIFPAWKNWKWESWSNSAENSDAGFLKSEGKIRMVISTFSHPNTL